MSDTDLAEELNKNYPSLDAQGFNHELSEFWEGRKL